MTRKPAAGWLWLTLLCCTVPSLCQPAPDAQQQSAAHLREAHRLLAENKPAAAVPELRAAVALDPSNVDAHANLGVLLFFQNNYAEAIPELREALRTKPDLPKIRALLGMGERRTGDIVNARIDLEKSFPDLLEAKVRVEAGMELIELYSADEELEKASAIVDTLRDLDPENQEVLYAAYRIHSDSAREALISLTLVAPKSGLMYQAMAHEAARRGDTPLAIREYQEAMKSDPKLPGLHFELAEMLRTLPTTAETSAKAKAEYEAALVQNPFDEKADLRLATMAYNDGDLKEAYKLYARAVELQPDDPEANFELGKMLATMGQPENAEKLMEHAAQIDPTNPVIHYRLSTVYRSLGRTEDAKREVQLFRKYKDLKETLRTTYRELHLDAQKFDVDESAPSK